ncbi:signal recognition particle-docking protein FtsY [candidate division WOR-3 bacterium]|nr:signal recognition particle-docking protein FtsY [candidate division WOR-3 bacterium]
MFNRFKQALKKATSLFSRTHGASFEEIESILLQADVGVKYTAMIMEALHESRNDTVTVIKREIVRLLQKSHPLIGDDRPQIIMVCGVNGSGKTTTVAKLAQWYRHHSRVILACADTYRDAASEQLAIWAQRADVEIVTSQKGQDAGAVVYDALAKAQAQSIGSVIIDTAGRLHTRGDLMEELKKIARVVTKFRPEGPHLSLLTIDANLGQNSIQQARVFKEYIGINGLILTKFDGTAKGGAVIPICNELELPVLFLGVGEGMDDLVEFDIEEFVTALFE